MGRDGGGDYLCRPALVIRCMCCVVLQELGRIHEEVQGSHVGLPRQAAAAGDRQEHVSGWDGMGWDRIGDDIIDAQSFFLKGYIYNRCKLYNMHLQLFYK